MSIPKFDRVVCVSLDRRPERWDRFETSLPENWPFGQVEHYPAVDGQKCPGPEWWSNNNAAWGCYKSHLNILEECLNNNIQSCLFFEDDAICCDDFTTKAKTFFRELPNDWEMIYLGGQHLFGNRQPPIKVSEHVYVPYNVNRTHAFALRGRKIMQHLYQHLNKFDDWKKGQHIDHHLGRIHQLRQFKIYSPNDWLIGQNEGRSDISAKTFDTRFFPPANSYHAIDRPFVIVLGLHRSGSSCLAMTLQKLGIHMGNRLVGYEQIHGGGGEAVGLAQICESAMPFPSTKSQKWPGTLMADLLTWIRERVREAESQNTIAGGKYPHLCRWMPQIEMMLGENLRVIHASRPLEESIASLIKRDQATRASKLQKLQRELWQSKQNYLSQTEQPVLTVEYNELLNSPFKIVDKVVQFLGIQPTVEQIAAASSHPNKSFRSVRPIC